MRWRSGASAARLVDAEHLIDRRVADRMRGDAPPGVLRLARERQQFVVLKAQDAARVGMSIRHAERGGRAAQAAIGEELHRVDPQPIRMVTASGQRHGADAIDQTQRHHVDPDRQPALAVDPPVGVEQLGRHARVGRARDAERQLMPQRGGDHRGVLVLRGWRDPAQHQAHRRFAKHAGRFAVRAAIDFASGAAPRCRARCPHRSSARLLQTTMCAQVRIRTTGRSLTAASRSARVGARPSEKRASL